MKKIIALLAVLVFSAVVLALTLRGIPGNPTAEELNDLKWKDDGPLELSPERGRFALMYSVLEDNSYQFSIPVARFTAPDVAVTNGQFVSLFAPALSFIIMPGYIIGKMFGISQVGAYAIISIFALINVVFIYLLAKRLGATSLAALSAALIFLFGTPAFAYAVSLYQHHVTTFLILSSLYVLHRWKNFSSLIYVWLACAVSIMIDSPNLFFMFGIGLYGLTRLFSFKATEEKYQLNIKVKGFFTFAVMIVPLLLFMRINQLSYGNPFQLAGTVASGDEVLERLAHDGDLVSSGQSQNERAPEQVPEKSIINFFNTRWLIVGLHTHFMSVDRGTLVYAPLAILGFLGLFFLANKEKAMFKVIIGTVGVIVVMYSLWGDPYGGWAFGSRYMIPAYALVSIGLALFLTRFRHYLPVIVLVGILAGYSFYVNAIGALTTNRIPPKVQVLYLEAVSGQIQRYTFRRGMEMLDRNQSKSFFFQTVGYKYFTAWQLTQLIIALNTTALSVVLLALLIQDNQFLSKLLSKVPSRKRKRP